jgi:hypothetical protein
MYILRQFWAEITAARVAGRPFMLRNWKLVLELFAGGTCCAVRALNLSAFDGIKSGAPGLCSAVRLAGKTAHTFSGRN